jgi:hypothetical protein
MIVAAHLVDPKLLFGCPLASDVTAAFGLATGDEMQVAG